MENQPPQGNRVARPLLSSDCGRLPRPLSLISFDRRGRRLAAHISRALQPPHPKLVPSQLTRPFLLGFAVHLFFPAVPFFRPFSRAHVSDISPWNQVRNTRWLCRSASVPPTRSAFRDFPFFSLLFLAPPGSAAGPGPHDRVFGDPPHDALSPPPPLSCIQCSLSPLCYQNMAGRRGCASSHSAATFCRGVTGQRFFAFARPVCASVAGTHMAHQVDSGCFSFRRVRSICIAVFF